MRGQLIVYLREREIGKKPRKRLSGMFMAHIPAGSGGRLPSESLG